MKKIAIFQNDLNVGGIQKSLINLLNNINLNKYTIDLYLFNKNNFFKNSIPSAINIIYLNPKPSFTKIIYFNLVKKIFNYEIKKDYDIAIDFNSYQPSTALAAINTKAKKKIMWIHNDIEKKLEGEIKYKVLHHFFKGKYKYFDTFVGVSKGVIMPFKKINKISGKKFVVIPNYIDTKEIINKSKEKTDLKVNEKKYNLVTLGRLTYQKGFDILINYINELKKIKKNFHLYIIGDGEEKEKLTNMVKNFNLTNYITFLGEKENPYKYLKLMDGFVLTSRYEGQGMVILEAATLGLEIFITKNLEKYNEGITGTNNIVKEISCARKKKKKINDLKEYNENISTKIEELFETE